MGALRPKFLGGYSGTRTPTKWGAKEGVRFFFQWKTKKKMEKIFCTFCKKIFQGFQNCFFFFHSSLKTEEVLFFYIYIYIFVYI